MVTDACGNSTVASATVTVPLSQGNLSTLPDLTGLQCQVARHYRRLVELTGLLSFKELTAGGPANKSDLIAPYPESRNGRWKVNGSRARLKTDMSRAFN
jgi:hypothetical protein